jgi:hypothetical protein
MSTDSTELTFVRCPSCRSLVPAKSTRCRMCGSALEAIAKNPDSFLGEGKKSRIRQKTASVEGSAVEEILQEFEQNPESRKYSQSEEVEDTSNDVVEPPIDDPLSAYIEEVDALDEQPRQATMSDDEEMESLDSSAKEVVSSFSTEVEEPDYEPESMVDDDPFEDIPPAKEVKPISKPAPIAQAAIETKSIHTNGNGKPHRPESVKHEEVRKPEVKREAVAVKSHIPVKEERKMESKPSTKPQIKNPGKLVGWLVSFKNSLGESIELREGRFFVTSSSLKPNDLVLNDPSISTPHAIMAVSNKRFAVQDLMSENGVWLKKQSETEFVQIEDSFTISHGDLVKFGDVEYLVVTIP